MVISPHVCKVGRGDNRPREYKVSPSPAVERLEKDFNVLETIIEYQYHNLEEGSSHVLLVAIIMPD